EDGPDDDHRNRDAAAQMPEEQGHRLEQLLGDARFLEGDAHEDEERHGEEGEVRHRAPDPDGEDVEEGRPEEAEGGPEPAEEEPGEGEAEGDGEAEEEERDHAREHEPGEDLVERQSGHAITWGAPIWPPTPPDARSTPGNPGRSSIARALIGSPTPWPSRT